MIKCFRRDNGDEFYAHNHKPVIMVTESRLPRIGTRCIIIYNRGL